VHRRSLSAVVGLTAAALALTACSGDTTAPARVDAAPATQPAQAAPAVPAELPSEEPSVAPGAEAEPTPVGPPKPTYDVAKAQRTLADLGYYLGAADGRRGPAFRSAVMAFQKVQGIGADGTVGPATLKALEAPRKPVLKGSGPSSRVEVDLTKQVLYVVKGGAVQRILPVSSGNGRTYEQKDGSEARALTPTGYYKIQRRIVGVREADLGTLYDPQYFYRGWAIHGSNSVPAVPASHGCVRVTRADATWLLSNISVGMSVYLYGGKHTFTAGSKAPGTDSPTGDTAADTTPTQAPSTPRPTRSPAPQPASSSSAPSPSPSSARPTPTQTPTSR
jgi:lipoprotein-anchoring transpeptidase ErfK/SrfK